MSVVTTLYLHSSRIPAASSWLDAMRNAGFDITFSTNLVITSVGGFFPVMLEGHETGFELFAEGPEELENLDEVSERIAIPNGGT